VFPLSALLDLLCPPICPVCGEVIDNRSGNGEPICSACLQKIVTPDGQFCRRCGGRQLVVASDAGECTRCRTTHFRFKRAIVLGEYQHDLRLLALRMKSDKTGVLSIAAAKALTLYRRTDLESAGADYIVPIPMHRLRRWDRGVNSPDLLAEELGQQLKIPVVRHLVRRIRQTNLQYTLSHRGRVENVAGAFALCSPRFWFAGPPLSGKNVLLVDDILTTGSTCNEITKILLAAGVKTVTVAALARAAAGMSQG
jgi:ComF family protein